MRKTCLYLIFMFCLLGSQSARAEMTLTTKIETALRAGRIDYQTALLYKAYSLFEPRRLPSEYQGEIRLRKSGTPILVELKAGWDTLDESVRRELIPYLTRPKSDFSCLSPGGDFRIHYDLSDENGVDPTDGDSNNIPDYIDQVAAVFDSCLVALLALGYPPPHSDGSQGGGSEYDVYVTELARRQVYGYTYPDEPIPDSFAYTSYIEIDNNYTDSIYQTTRGIEALRVTAAHEFFHAIHFSYYAREDVRWWMEVSATWMEDVIYDYVNDYYAYLRYLFERPGISLDTVDEEHEYGASVFAHYLAERFDKDVIRSLWERIAQRGTAGLSVFDEVIPGGMAAAMAEFSLWNCFTGTRADTLRYYSEGDYYPEVLLKATHRQYPAQGSGSTGHLAANYVRFIPGNPVGGLRIDPQGLKGNWSFQVACFPPEEAPTTTTNVLGWSRYNEIFLILTGTSSAGGPFAYSYSAQFDPDLTEELPVVVEVPGSSGAPGDTLDIPVMVSDVTGMEITYVRITVTTDTTVLKPYSCSTQGTIAQSWGTPAFSIIDGQMVIIISGSQAIENDGPLIYLRYVVDPDAADGDRTTVRVVSLVFNLGKSPTATHNGLFRVVRLHEIAGAVLRQSWPNPVNIIETPKMTIPFDLVSSADVVLSIYSVNGQLVWRKELGHLLAGSHNTNYWDGTDQHGRPVASGIYLYQLKANNFVNTKKMLLIK